MVDRPKFVINEMPTNDDSKTRDSTTTANVNNVKFMSAFGRFGSFLRALAKQALYYYNYYNAEIQFGECMIKYTYSQYPQQMQLLRMANINKLGHLAYAAIAEYLTNVLNGHYIDAYADQERIAAKIVQLTRPSNLPRPQQQYPAEYVQSIRRKKREKPLKRKQRSTEIVTSKNDTESVSTKMPDDEMEHRSFDDENALVYFENHRKLWHEDVHQRYMQDREEEDSLMEDERIELNNVRTVEAVDDLFDWEPVILDSLGIDPRRIKKYSPGYCLKNYIFAFFRRIIMEYIRSG